MNTDHLALTVLASYLLYAAYVLSGLAAPEIPPTPDQYEGRMFMDYSTGDLLVHTGSCSNFPAHVHTDAPWGQKIHMYCSKEAK